MSVKRPVEVRHGSRARAKPDFDGRPLFCQRAAAHGAGSWTLATLSFALDETPKPVIDDTENLVVKLLKGRRPQMLLCAGYTFDGFPSRVQLVASKVGAMVVGEVRAVGGVLNYVFGRGGRLLGIQAFSSRSDTNAATIALLSSQLSCRKFGFSTGMRAFLLICGEISLVHAARRVQGEWRPDVGEAIKASIRSSHLIFNPVHSRMGNAGILHAKRAFLSQTGIYVGCSNWRAYAAGKAGRRQYPSETLHVLYQKGLSKSAVYEFREENFVYREWRIRSTAAPSPCGGSILRG